jgi:hypothetical protein
VGTQEQTRTPKHGLFIGIALILLAAVFTFTGCSDDGGTTSGDSLKGTYTGSDFTLVFTDTTWELLVNGNTQREGTYTLDGTALTLTTGGESFSGTAVVSGNTLTLSGFTGDAAGLNGSCTKQSTGGGDPTETLAAHRGTWTKGGATLIIAATQFTIAGTGSSDGIHQITRFYDYGTGDWQYNFRPSGQTSDWAIGCKLEGGNLVLSRSGPDAWHGTWTKSTGGGGGTDNAKLVGTWKRNGSTDSRNDLEFTAAGKVLVGGEDHDITFSYSGTTLTLYGQQGQAVISGDTLVISGFTNPQLSGANGTYTKDTGGGSSLSGTYQNSDFTIVFTATNFIIHYQGSLMASGTYTLNGTALTLITSDGDRDEGTASLNGNTLILSGFPHAHISGTYTRQ